MFPFGGKKKDQAIDAVTERMKKKAQELCQSLDAFTETPQPAVRAVTPAPPAVGMPKKIKEKLKVADEKFEQVQRMSMRTSLLARILNHTQSRESNAIQPR